MHRSQVRDQLCLFGVFHTMLDTLLPTPQLYFVRKLEEEIESCIVGSSEMRMSTVVGLLGGL